MRIRHSINQNTKERRIISVRQDAREHLILSRKNTLKADPWAWAGKNPGGSSGSMENENTPDLNKGTGTAGRHTLIMALCCLVPLWLLGILWVAGVSQNILSFGILLLCPVMHLVMMRNMKHDTQKPESTTDVNEKEEHT